MEDFRYCFLFLELGVVLKLSIFVFHSPPCYYLSLLIIRLHSHLTINWIVVHTVWITPVMIRRGFRQLWKAKYADSFLIKPWKELYN